MEDNSRSARPLTQAQFVNALGDGAFYATSVLYFTTVAGLTPQQWASG